MKMTFEDEPANYLIMQEIQEIGLYLFKLYNQWANYIEKCQRVANPFSLHVLDLTILHLIRGRNSPTFFEIITALNKFDTAAVTYSLQKLIKIKLIQKISAKNQKNIKYLLAEEGRKHTEKYVQLRKKIINEIVKIEELEFFPELINYFRYLKIIYEESTLHNASLNINKF